MADEGIRTFLPGQADENAPGGIGTLSEKTVHAFLKNLYMPDPSMQEIPLGKYVADIFDGNTVTEIQTRNFAVLRRKLDSFLPLCPVRVVYPVVCSLSVVWTDPETGAASSPRKSPKHGKPTDALHELWQIRDYLTNPELTVEIVLLNAEEYRIRNGRGPEKKKGGTKADRVPTELVEILRFERPEDYRIFLPDTLPDKFSAPEYGKAAGLRQRQAYSAVHVLESLGLIGRAPKDDVPKGGKKRTATLYRVLPAGQKKQKEKKA